MDLIDDAFQLVNEIIRKNPYSFETILCNISLEEGNVLTEEDSTYNLPETPYYLVKEGIMEVDSTSSYYRIKDVIKGEKVRQLSQGFWGGYMHDKNLKGLIAVSFDVNKTKKWLKSEVRRRLGITQVQIGKKPENWKWFDKKDGKYQFGVVGIYSQRGKIRKKVFQTLMDIYEKSPNAISISSVKELTGLKAERIRIEICAINVKLRKFGLFFEGSRQGYYILKNCKKSS
jgi:hypothetical protein